ncbi:hypothetical protein AB1Y20_019376 [Prymnesium parvum]|uniref:Uncharacterized protein n=1 Tax=Prymnesium parvum TaxID=97485 RepID=A0AB34JTY1_PRYPA
MAMRRASAAARALRRCSTRPLSSTARPLHSAAVDPPRRPPPSIDLADLEYEEYYYDDDEPRPSSARHQLSRHEREEISESVPPHLMKGEHLNLVRMPWALDAALQRYSIPRIKAAQAVRADGATHEPTIDDFVALRLDLSFGACRRAMHEVSCRLPDFTPARVLEFGAGLAPGCWAAHATWPATAAYVAVESNTTLRSTGESLALAAADAGDSPSVTWASSLGGEGGGKGGGEGGGEVGGGEGAGTAAYGEGAASGRRGEGVRGTFDLVMSAYALSALPGKGQCVALDALWERTAEGGVLVLIEQKLGAEAMSAARLQLLAKSDAHLLAPHPPNAHRAATEGELPWAGWLSRSPRSLMGAAKRSNVLEKVTSCHLLQNVEESVARQAHQVKLRRGRERRVVTEMFGYLLCLKVPEGSEIPADGMWGRRPYGRVITVPRKRRKHTLLDVLTPEGTLEPFVATRSKSNPRDYRYLRKVTQGDTVAMEMLIRKSA